jgi:hypothetical protein
MGRERSHERSIKARSKRLIAPKIVLSSNANAEARMSIRLEIVDLGGELGVVLPEDIAAQLVGLSELVAEQDGTSLVLRIPNKPDVSS